jgi:hypothetical protein
MSKMTDVSELVEAWHDACKAVDTAKRVRYDAETALIDGLRVSLNRPNGRLVLGSWGCPESPTKECIYDFADHSLSGDDECIFCGDPNERK